MWRLLFLLGALGTLAASVRSSPDNIDADPPFVSAQGFCVGPDTLVVKGETMRGLFVDFYHLSTIANPWGASAGMNNTTSSGGSGNPGLNAVTLQTDDEETSLYLQIIAALLPRNRIAVQEATWSITDPRFSITDNPEAQLGPVLPRTLQTA